ncbi:MAG: hypothetical protein IPK32_19535 [Verrucomicrobiaceae bacterium]|nr:hypothetical protein [Verrucomicrobiaceae bacterium]
MRSNPLAILIAFAVAMYATVDIMTGYTGPLAASAKWIGVLMVLASFVKPMTGLYLLSFMSFYGDFYKKLAVVYGSASMEAVIEVLAVNMAIVGAIIAGTINQILTTGPKPSRPVVITALISFGVTGLMMLSSGPLTGRVQMAVNGGLYLAIAAVIAHYYRTVPGSSLRLSRFHFILGIPWVLVAVYQYFFGFADMDYVYARTGLSPVYSASFFQPEPRVFGLAGSGSAYGAICFCFIYGVWAWKRLRTERMLYLVGSLLYFIGLVVSKQRTVLLLPFIVPVVYIMFLTPGRTKLLYIMLVVVVVTLIGSSNFLMSHLASANEGLASTTGEGAGLVTWSVWGRLGPHTGLDATAQTGVVFLVWHGR